jgi:L-asparaginase
MGKSILLIYTGGTIGMVADTHTGGLSPFDFEHLLDQVPELQRLDIHLDCSAFDPPVDSSDMNQGHWLEIAQTIVENYGKYDGFVVLHGTDTMAYSASAVSFMLRNLAKPVIFTGSQLPVGVLRTDGKENLITAIHLAALEKQGDPYVQEVAIYFGSSLFRANRTHKYSAEDFNAFHSPNLAPLAEAGIHLQFRHDLLLRPMPGSEITLLNKVDDRVAVLKLFPGISEQVVKSICEIEQLRGLVIETFGSGNGPTAKWFVDAMRLARSRGVNIVNVTQCSSGFVEQGRYATSASFTDLGVIPGGDMTLEAAITKLMHVIAYHRNENDIALAMMTSLSGELTTYSSLV